MKAIKLWGLFLALASICANARAEVKLPAIFGDHMVLQQAAALPVWGWADPGEPVTIAIGNQKASTVADKDGKWMVKLAALKNTSDSLQLQVTGKNTITISDVLIGDVWICSGQSNMEWPLWATNNGREEAAKANYPKMRFFKVSHKPALEPLADCQGKWEVCDPSNAGGISAVGYYFGRDLHRKLVGPVGLIGSHWGGDHDPGVDQP